MSEPTKNTLPQQFTVRLGNDELEYINENLHLITDGEAEMPRSRIFVNAVTRAIQNQPKVKEVTIDNPEHLKTISEQKETIANLQEMFEQVQQTVEQLQNEALNLPPGAIVLNLKPQFRKYFWGILELSKKQQFAATYEELLEKMFTVFNARDEFKYTTEDVEYLKTLTYDGPAEN
jgi:23S rRNA maturation-related 3'-5' exoribonuclease YhaM